MDYRDDEHQAAWRTEVRSFLNAEAPKEYIVDHKPAVDSYGLGDETYQTWRKTVAGKGWLASHWPSEYGGAGMSTMEQFVMKEEFARHRVPHPGGRGIEMVGPTIILHGTDQQKKELLPPILHGEHIYSQGFSEPGAGSDLAAVQLRAVREGDEYVLNGQKIWTSNGTSCNWMFLLARSDPEAPKHKGISYFVTPTDNVEGLEIRTITDMTGGNELCESFFDNVRIPAQYRIGEENRGWYVAMTTLDFERSGIAGAIGIQQQIIDLAKDLGGKVDGPKRLELADLYLSSEVARQMSYQVAALQDRGGVPNYEASMVKLFSSELGQRLARTSVNLYKLSGQLLAGSKGYEVSDGRIAHSLSRSLPSTIAGGSSEVQRGIIATRGLGLPRG